MMYLDYRLSKILSEDLIKQSRSIRDRKHRHRSELPDQPGFSPIVQEERPPGDKPKAA